MSYKDWSKYLLFGRFGGDRVSPASINGVTGVDNESASTKGAVSGDAPISYQDIVIDKSNVDTFRQNKLLPSGHVDTKNGTGIVLYRYSISPELGLRSDDPLRGSVKRVRDAEQVTIAHEGKHWDNAKFGCIEEMGLNFYEMAMLHAMDEVSAYATGNFRLAPLKDNNFAILSLLRGAQDFINAMDEYKTPHMRAVQSAMLNNQKMVLDLLVYADKREPQYSAQYHNVVNQYFALGGHSPEMLKKNALYTHFNGCLAKIRREYEASVKKCLIDPIVAELCLHK